MTNQIVIGIIILLGVTALQLGCRKKSASPFNFSNNASISLIERRLGGIKLVGPFAELERLIHSLPSSSVISEKDSHLLPVPTYVLTIDGRTWFISDGYLYSETKNDMCFIWTISPETIRLEQEIEGLHWVKSSQ